MQSTSERGTESRLESSSRVIAILAGTVAIVVALLLVPAVILAGLPIAVALLVLVAAVVGPTVLLAKSRGGAEEHVLELVGATLPPEPGVSRMANVVEGLCLTMGMPKPRLLWLDAPEPIALAATGPSSPGAIVVSSGFVSEMDRMETEAVVAHLLVGLRSGTYEAHCFAITMHDLMSRWGLGSLAGSVLSRTMTVQSPHAIDAEACRVTRYPPALVSALSKISSHEHVGGGGRGVIGRVGCLLFALPGEGDAAGGDGLPSLGEVRLTAGERIDLIKEI